MLQTAQRPMHRVPPTKPLLARPYREKFKRLLMRFKGHRMLPLASQMNLGSAFLQARPDLQLRHLMLLKKHNRQKYLEALFLRASAQLDKLILPVIHLRAQPDNILRGN